METTDSSFFAPNRINPFLVRDTPGDEALDDFHLDAHSPLPLQEPAAPHVIAMLQTNPPLPTTAPTLLNLMHMVATTFANVQTHAAPAPEKAYDLPPDAKRTRH